MDVSKIVKEQRDMLLQKYRDTKLTHAQYFAPHDSLPTDWNS